MTHDFTRRGFLAAGAAALTSLAARGADDAFGGYRVGAQTYTWRQFTLEQTLERMQKLGLGYAEFATGHVPPNSSPEQVAAVLRLCKDYGVKPAGAGVFQFSKDTSANRRLFDLGKALGVQYLSADPAPDAFDSLDKLCEEYQIAVAIHPHGPGGKNLHRWYSAESIMAAVKDHHPLIGACLDTGHLIRSAQPPFGKKLDPAQQVRLMGKRNFAMHLKDHDNEKREDVIFGQGVLDVASILEALKEVGFTGTLEIEYEAKPSEPTSDVAACLDVFKKAATRA